MALGLVFALGCASYPSESREFLASRAKELHHYYPDRPFCALPSAHVERNLVFGRVGDRLREGGVRPGDRIAAIDARPLRTWHDLVEAMGERAPGQPIELGLRRGLERLSVSVECEDGRAALGHLLAALEAGSRGEWDRCLGALAEYEAATIESAETGALRLRCSEARRISRGRSPSFEEASVVYDFSRMRLEDAAYGEDIEQARVIVARNAGWLRENGYPSLAEDIDRLLREGYAQEAAGRRPLGKRSGRREVGSGFFVSDEGHVLTNHHVVAQCDRVGIDRDGAFHPAASTRLDPTNDLALLHVEGVRGSPLPFRGDGAVRAGEDVLVVGFPLSGLLAADPKVTEGIVSAAAGPDNDTRLLQLTNPIQPGSSGGPVLDTHGRVVGVVVSKLDAIRVAVVTGDIPQNVNFAIKSQVGEMLLQAAGVEYEVRRSPGEVSPMEVAEAAALAVVAVVCER